MAESLLAPELVWGLIPRFVGVLYIIAFGSLIPQIESLIGARGLFPAAARLACVRRDFPGPRRFFDHPTVLWLNSSDNMIKLVPWLGVLCGLVAVYGGPLSPWALGLGWFFWLSLESAALIFPWDTLLQEVGFLVLFLPAAEALPSLEASALPLPSVTFMFRWLVLRLMLGFGKLKFVGARKQDALYLRGFFVWMPLPTPLSWFGHHAPRWLLKLMLYFMFAAEVIAPVLGLFAGPLRLVSFALLVGLMVGIMATGNWGYFNIGYILLCFCLLDSQASLFDLFREPWIDQLWQWPTVGINAALLIMFLMSLLNLVAFDSWVTRTWTQWPMDDLLWNRPWVRAIVRFFRALAPFRLVNGYGVFPPRAVPPFRMVPVFEGSDDGVHWKAYAYRFMPTRASDRAPFVAPHHPRLDMASSYAGAAVHDGSFYSAGIGDGTAHAAWTRSSWLDRFAQRLLAGDPLILRTLRHNPFPDAPPKFVRASTVAMTPSRPEERRATGHWWHVRRLGVIVPPRTRESWPDAFVFPEPEVFHPDWVNYKRRSAPLRAITRAFQQGMAPDEAVLQASDLSADEVRRFWREFVPAVSEERGNFARLQERAGALKERFGVPQIFRFERILERFAWLLRVRTEHHYFADAQPKIPIKSNFRYHLLLQEIVLDGPQAYRGVLDDPARAAARAERSSDETQLWGLALIRNDLFNAHVCAFRWYTLGRENHAAGIPGLFEYYPLIATIVPPYEEFRPDPVHLPDGEHSVEGFYPPPRLAPWGE